MSDFGENNFDRTFDFFKPIIQGTSDTTNKLTQAEFSGAIHHITQALFRPNWVTYSTKDDVKAAKPTQAEQEIIDGIRKRQAEHLHSIKDFTTNVINGRVPRLQRGNLGLVAFESAPSDSIHSK